MDKLSGGYQPILPKKESEITKKRKSEGGVRSMIVFLVFTVLTFLCGYWVGQNMYEPKVIQERIISKEAIRELSITATELELVNRTIEHPDLMSQHLNKAIEALEKSIKYLNESAE